MPSTHALLHSTTQQSLSSQLCSAAKRTKALPKVTRHHPRATIMMSAASPRKGVGLHLEEEEEEEALLAGLALERFWQAMVRAKRGGLRSV